MRKLCPFSQMSDMCIVHIVFFASFDLIKRCARIDVVAISPSLR